MSAIEILKKASELGLKLGFEPPNTLTYEPAGKCPADFRETLCSHKAAILELLRLPWVPVYIRAIGEELYFCEDEPTKAALVAAGTDRFSVYTKRELRQLIASNRLAPISQGELETLHQIKRTFNARIVPNGN